VIVRIVSIIALCVFLAACAQSPILSSSGFNTAGLQALPTVSASEMSNLGHQTLAGKVLTAIALERVTGLKPDPSRFSDVE